MQWVGRLTRLVAGAVVLHTVLASASESAEVQAADAATEPRCFPDEFMFGAATAAYQVEGAAFEGGRTASVWDEYCRTHPGVMCANVADDFYHRYKDDIELMTETGLQSFRFSISWSRAMTWDPATRRMRPNAEGIAFYRAMIGELRRRNIEPILTLYHYDLPLALETELSPPGWLNPRLSDHFAEFAALMYAELGREVTYWSTFNEPQGLAGYFYGMKFGPPAIDPTPTAAYTASYHILVSHAKAVQKFREAKARGLVGAKAGVSIVQVAQFYYPLDPSNPKDVAAADRAMQFELGWFLLPTITGDWPPAMRAAVGGRLPEFTEEESRLLKGSYDLFMLNHYFSRAVTDCDSSESHTACDSLFVGWQADKGVDDSHLMPGSMPGKLDSYGRTYCEMFTGYPAGYLDVIKWVHAKDPTADILLTENGWCGDGEVDNMDQLQYFKAFVEQVHKAVVEEKIPVIGYTAWSLLDNYEWGSYGPRFGLYYVNFTSQTGSPDFYEPKATDLARIPRPSAKWFQKVATTKCLDDWIEVETASALVDHSLPWSLNLAGVAVVAAVATVALVQFRRRAGYSRIPMSSS